MEREHGVICGGRFTADGGGEAPLQALIEERRTQGWRYAGMLRAGEADDDRVGPYDAEEELEATVVPTPVVVRWERIG